MSCLLVDLGGTSCRVGLSDGTGLLSETARSFANADFTSLSDLLTTYLDTQRPGPVTALCAGVAGPVRNGTAQLTNHAWHIEANSLAQATGAARVHLMNDLQAQAHALDDLDPDSLTPLVPGTPDPDGPRMVLGLGTGCNIAVAHRVDGRLFVPPSESGHTTLPDAPGFRALYDSLRGEAAHLPLEAALSGPGLTRLHAFYTGETLTPAEIMALEPRKTLQAFVSLLGLAASNLCLSHMATGGLYLIGGTARAIAPHLKPLGFADTFHPRGPYSDILAAIPVTLISDDNAALRGCARYIVQYLK
ncbi:glucokinase [Roseovarius atlanticus]|uniref:glucokinase n=1 Tax=Roseovarius atlanticus TaxID=1641875 RepID=UPI001C942AB9|nr:glucokinase [Roseovarius atlanticus]MBY5989612.1 glucokinase [Roseovarius atlanticus]MBY6126157.1 glucokinase [Roseovarius atlanticus]MBY6150651.1 glucokinase [Roseovarius atlanticus]